ncbi:MAG: hypothetical protein WD733_08990 [Bryobacterales bacterium]
MKTRLRSDGTLDIHVPTGLPESDVEVLLLIEPVLNPADVWPEGFFERTFAAFAEQTLERLAQGCIDSREALR